MPVSRINAGYSRFVGSPSVALRPCLHTRQVNVATTDATDAIQISRDMQYWTIILESIFRIALETFTSCTWKEHVRLKPRHDHSGHSPDGRHKSTERAKIVWRPEPVVQTISLRDNIFRGFRIFGRPVSSGICDFLRL